MAAYTSTQSGDFNADATWGGGGHPTSSGDTASIGHAVTTSGGAVCGAVTVTNGGSFDTGSTASTITSITTSGNGTVTIGSGGCTLAGVLNNAGTGTLTISGACTGVTTFTPSNCTQNASVACTVLGEFSATGQTWNINANLTGMTSQYAFTRGTCTINVAAGVTISFNSASTLRFGMSATGGVLNLNGTSGSHVTLTNTGTGDSALCLSEGGVTQSVFASWVDAHSLYGDGTLMPGVSILNDCQFSRKAANAVTVNVRSCVTLNRCFLGNGNSAFVGRYDGHTTLNDCAIGYLRNGTSATATVGFDVYGEHSVTCRNLVINSATPVTIRKNSYSENSGVSVDNMGFVTASSMSGVVTARGIGKQYLRHGTFERSSASPKSGQTFSARVTPSAYFNASMPLQFSIMLPVTSGDNISVSVYGRRKTLTDGGPQNTIAQITIDPEGTWYTPTTSAAVAMTNAEGGSPEWYQFTAAASTAGGSAVSGMVRVVLQVLNYTNSGYFDWADFTATVGGNSYTVNFEKWANGLPVADISLPVAEIAAAMWSNVTSPNRSLS